jgi:hypothetical protein
VARPVVAHALLRRAGRPQPRPLLHARPRRGGIYDAMAVSWLSTRPCLSSGSYRSQIIDKEATIASLSQARYARRRRPREGGVGRANVLLRAGEVAALRPRPKSSSSTTRCSSSASSCATRPAASTRTATPGPHARLHDGGTAEELEGWGRAATRRVTRSGPSASRASSRTSWLANVALCWRRSRPRADR